MLNIAFCFDDGRKDQYRAAREILMPINFSGTFYLTTGYIEGILCDEDMPCLNEPMTLEDAQTIADVPYFEIGAHGIKHNNDINNLLASADKLRADYMFDLEKPIGIASPCSRYDLNRMAEDREALDKNNISYLRIGARKASMNFAEIWIRRFNRILHIPYLYYWTNRKSICRKNDDYILYVVPVLRDNRYVELKYFIDKLIIMDKSSREDISCIFGFHSILQKGEPYYRDLFSWDYFDFKKICGYIKHLSNEKKIRVCTVTEIKNSEGKNSY